MAHPPIDPASPIPEHCDPKKAQKLKEQEEAEARAKAEAHAQEAAGKASEGAHEEL